MRTFEVKLFYKIMVHRPDGVRCLGREITDKVVVQGKDHDEAYAAAIAEVVDLHAPYNVVFKDWALIIPVEVDYFNKVA